MYATAAIFQVALSGIRELGRQKRDIQLPQVQYHVAQTLHAKRLPGDLLQQRVPEGMDDRSVYRRGRRPPPVEGRPGSDPGAGQAATLRWRD